jgi:hypothetical protein
VYYDCDSTRADCGLRRYANFASHFESAIAPGIATLVVVPRTATQDTVPSYRTAPLAGVCPVIFHVLNLPAKS